MLWIKEVEMSIRWTILNYRAQFEGFSHFPIFWDAGCDDCFCSEQDHPEFLFQGKRSVWRNRRLRKKIISFAEYTSLTWSATASSLLTIMTLFLITLICPQSLFAMMMFLNLIRDGMKFYLSMIKILPGDVLESLDKLGTRAPDQLKTVLELYDMEIHENMSMPDCQKLKTMVKRSTDQKLILRNFDARHERIKTGAVVTNRGGQRGVERGQGECFQWKAKGQCSRGDKCSFRHNEDKRAKPTPKKLLHILNHQQRGRSVRGKERQRPESTWEVRDSRAKITWKVFTRSLRDYWHPPECQCFSSELEYNFADKCSFAHKQIEGQPRKNRNRMVTKVQWLYWKMHGSWVAYFRTQSRQNLYLTEEHKSLGINSTSAIHKSYTASCKHSRTQRSVGRKNSSQSSSSAQSLRSGIWG